MDLRPPRNRADRRAVGWWTVQCALFLGPLAVAAVAAFTLLTERPPWLGVLVALFAAGCAVLTVIWPRALYRTSRWEVTDDAVYTRSGWLTVAWRIAPMSRVQTVDTARGPVQRLFGLSDVTVTTASAAGAVTIEGLDHAVAAGLAERLTTIAQLTPGDAT